MRALPKASGVSEIRAEGVRTPLGRVSCGPGRRVQARAPGTGDIYASHSVVLIEAHVRDVFVMNVGICIHVRLDGKRNLGQIQNETLS